jgi:hypothetical protein
VEQEQFNKQKLNQNQLPTLQASAQAHRTTRTPRRSRQPIPGKLGHLTAQTAENTMKSPLKRLTTPSCHGRIQPSNSPFDPTIHDRHLQTPHRKDRLPRRRC